ncbi:MAG: response regulator [Methylotenera sp.]|nr:response regulator [Methylotenera sp.]
MKIALLKNDLSSAETIQEWLQEAGFEVDHFATGLDFLRKFPHLQYDLCIFDWALPDMEGPDVMVSIKLKSSNLPPHYFHYRAQ